MANKLWPRGNATFLSPREVQEKLVREFPCFEADRGQGRSHAEQKLAKLRQLNAPQVVIDSTAAGLADAVAMFMADKWDTEHVLHFTVIPNEPIFVGYSSGQNEEALQPLLKRCAKALGYKIQLL